MSAREEVIEQVRLCIHSYLLGMEPHATSTGLAAELAASFDIAPRGLLAEADGFISHMLYRNRWPGERHEVERLISALRVPSTRTRFS